MSDLEATPASPDLTAQSEAALCARDIDDMTRASNGLEHAAGFQIREAMRALRQLMQATNGRTLSNLTGEQLTEALLARRAMSAQTLESVRAQLEQARAALGEEEQVGELTWKDIGWARQGMGRVALITRRNAARAALAPDKIDALLSRARRVVER